MDNANEKPRKDRLIQTRVPQNLENTLKDEARKRRLSVSHLIRNVLEDTFDLVDNVVHEVDRVVADSVGVANTLRRDAQRLAATARGETEHRKPRPGRDPAPQADAEGAAQPVQVDAEATEDPVQVNPEATTQPLPEDAEATEATAVSDPFSTIYAFQDLVLNRPASCAGCGVALGRGERAYLGLGSPDGAPKVWACQECIEKLPGER